MKIIYPLQHILKYFVFYIFVISNNILYIWSFNYINFFALSHKIVILVLEIGSQ
jgi:hypothetical protein